jgi:hypothetical protein
MFAVLNFVFVVTPKKVCPNEFLIDIYLLFRIWLVMEWQFGWTLAFSF